MALKRLAFGAAALSAARAIQTALAFLALPLLARILGPADFGLVALAMAFVLFTMAFSDAGMGQSLVRTPPHETEVWSSAFWLIAILSAGLTLLLLLLAWPSAWAFDEPRLAPLVMALAPLPLVQGMLSPAIADLQQREKFGQLALAEILGAVLGATAAIWVAFAGGGAWALVAQQLGTWGGKAAVVVSVTRFRPRFVLQLSGLEPHFRFGRDTASWSLVNFLARQIDPLVIAKLIGIASLGLYSMAYRLMTLPAHLVSGPVQSALYTRMVALRGDLPALKSLVLMASRALAAFVFPPMAILCVASSAFVEVFLSERWLPAATLFSIMAPVGALTAVTGLNGPVFMAIGRTDLRLRLTVEFTLLWAVAVPFLAMQGVTAIAIGQAALFLLYLPRMLQLFLQPIGASFRAYAGAIAIPTLIACGLAASHIVLRSALSVSTWAEIMLAVGEILAGYGLLAWTLRGRLTGDLLAARRLFAAPPSHMTVADPSPVAQK